MSCHVNGLSPSFPLCVQLNMNNIRDIKREQFTELFEGLATNTTLEELHLCNTGIGDLVAQV